MRISATRPLSVQKDRHKATIFLAAYRITGTIHLPVGARVSDYVNFNVNEGPFIPLTDVSVYTADSGELLFSTDFLAVHRNQISFLAVDKEGPAPQPGKP